VVTSEGYSIYAFRDIVARFVWAGCFGSTLNITCTDNRQAHSFKQVFHIVTRLAESDIYAQKLFGPLTADQTQRACDILKTPTSLSHVAFGFMTLPEGAMSARKGVVLLFDTLKSKVEKEVERVLLEKNEKLKQNQAFYVKVQKIAVAALKWQDLSRDREQDIVFDIGQVTKFEGNTGIYQLYTLSRISNILRRQETTARLHPESVILLNQTELEIIKKMYSLPVILEQVSGTLKPHILCQYLFELTTLINSWYAIYPVGTEADLSRKDALLHLITKMTKHIEFCLELLGISPINEM
jgi:arginyl-tRNA synthetase